MKTVSHFKKLGKTWKTWQMAMLFVRFTIVNNKFLQYCTYISAVKELEVSYKTRSEYPVL